MAHINWSEVAKEIVSNSSWGREEESVSELIKKAGHSELSFILLVDIAKSLWAIRRTLDCRSFQQIPKHLCVIEKNTRKAKKKKKRA